MSLIGDALRKTRQEAADREIDRQGVLFSAKIADSPARSNLGLGLAIGAVIAIGATVIGGGTVWWLLSGTEMGRSSPPGAAAPAAPGIVETGETPVDTPSPSSAEAGTNPPAQPAIEASTASQTEAAPTESPPDQSAAEFAAATAQAAAPAGRDSGLAEGFAGMEDGDEIYILEADLGDVRLSLDFIVSRADDPFVEINGTELHLGGVIEGFRVKAIGTDRVRLSNGRRSIVLRAP